MAKLLYLMFLTFLVSCSSTTYFISLDGKELEDGYYKYTPSVEIGDYSNTFISSESRILTLYYEDQLQKKRFRILEPKVDPNNKLIIMTPGHNGIWFSLMATANLFLNKGYHIAFIDYYGQKYGYRGEFEEDWGEKEIDEVKELVGAFKSIKKYKNYQIGYFGSSLGGLIGLSALTGCNDIQCFVAEGLPVSPRKSANQIKSESFWLNLFLDLDDYEDLINRYDPLKNLDKINKKTSIMLFWGEDDKFYFEEEGVKLKQELKEFNKSKFIIIKDAIHSNRLGNKITQEKFDEINELILDFFEKNLKKAS